MIAAQLLTALPPVEPTADDPDYVARLATLLETSRASRKVPFIEE